MAKEFITPNPPNPIQNTNPFPQGGEIENLNQGQILF